jgi:hypothetical protein
VDSEIHSVTIDPAEQSRIAEFDIDALARVVFSVRPILIQTDWLAGNGDQTQDSWVRQKSLYVGLKEEYGRYWLVILGIGL